MERSGRDPVDLDRRGDRRIVLRRRVIIGLTVPAQAENSPAVVFDISCTGIGLVVAVPLEPGAEVAIAWEHGARRRHRTIMAKVVHAALGRDGSWRVGCMFYSALEKRDLRAFLRHCARLYKS